MLDAVVVVEALLLAFEGGREEEGVIFHGMRKGVSIYFCTILADCIFLPVVTTYLISFMQ